MAKTMQKACNNMNFKGTMQTFNGVADDPKIAQNSTSLQPHQKNSDAQNSRKIAQKNSTSLQPNQLCSLFLHGTRVVGTRSTRGFEFKLLLFIASGATTLQTGLALSFLCTKK